jgi:hypothetical protein
MTERPNDPAGDTPAGGSSPDEPGSVPTEPAPIDEAADDPGTQPEADDADVDDAEIDEDDEGDDEGDDDQDEDVEEGAEEAEEATDEGAAAAGAGTGAVARRRRGETTVAAGSPVQDAAVKIDDWVSQAFVIGAVAIFTIILLNALLFGVGGFFDQPAGPEGSPAPSDVITPTEAPAESVEPTPTEAPSPTPVES